MPQLMYEQFKINNNVSLSNQDLYVLTNLYLPLIGMDSYCLYIALSTLIEKQEYTFKYIIDLLNVSNIKTITSASEKLEGIGLLKSYYNEEKGYYYNLIKPLTKEQFVQESVLIDLLEKQIGKLEIEKIKASVKKVPNTYKTVTKRFDEVFTTKTTDQQLIINNILKPSLEFKNNDFNYTLFKMLFSSKYISEDVLNSDEFKNIILKVSVVYKLNEEDMKDAVIQTIDIDKKFDYATLSKNARKMFQEKYKVDTPRLTTIKDDNYISSIKDDNQLQLCAYLENITPPELLQELSGIKPSVSELKIVEDLLKNTNFSTSVINMMLLIVLSEKEGQMPGYNYFEKIANTWARANIKTPIDVINYNDRQKEKISKAPTKKLREAPLPEWYNDYQKEIDETTEQTVDSKEEMDRLVKKLFGE